MVDVWSAVRWWDEWQLRILVLGSLGLQWFLLVAAPIRKYSISQKFRLCTWLAYISSDALAIYALATLFNRHSKVSNDGSCGGGKAGVLEILWAPVLLVHLGGQRELTAYNIEDNELWLRHAVTLVSQVAVAVYAFYKSWPNSTDRRLWACAMVLFVLGVLSFCEKPWAFRRARIHRLAAAAALVHGKKPVSKWSFCINELDEEKYESKLERVFWCCTGTSGKDMAPGWSIRNQVHMILSDMSLFAAFSELERRGQHGRRVLLPPVGAEKFSIEWLRKSFRLIYTRANVAWTPAYLAYHLLLVPALYVAAITLFAVSHKRGVYNPADVKTTYVLLSFTAALDLFGVFIAGLLHRLMAYWEVPSLCQRIAQYNLIDAVLRRRQRIGCVIKCAAYLGSEEVFFRSKHEELYSKVSGYLVIDWLRSSIGGMKMGVDLSSYRNLEDPDNNWALGDLLREDATVFGDGTEVRKSLHESFDRSVLVWHIATDLCLCKKPPPFPLQPREVRTVAISNYMAHLLNSRPDMLMVGSRKHLFTEAIDDIREILQPQTVVGHHFTQTINSDLNDELLADCIYRQVLDSHGCKDNPKCESSSSPEYPLVHDACRLAQQLLGLADEDTRLEIMYRVWLGMLFYSAAMCRGYLHAKSLGEGGEFLSFVWLLLATTGSKTLADNLQMPQHQDVHPQPTHSRRYSQEENIIPDLDFH
ncbi:hypothetical protein ABZP36_036149 [Zizania latifolia]